MRSSSEKEVITVYCQTGIFSISVLLIYGKAERRSIMKKSVLKKPDWIMMMALM